MAAARGGLGWYKPAKCDKGSAGPVPRPHLARASDRLNMHRVIISGIGAEIPEPVITNDELVESFNSWVEMENARRARTGEAQLQKSDSAFVEHASGVRTRHVIEREGILDPTRMTPRIPARPDDALSLEAEFGIASAKKA